LVESIDLHVKDMKKNFSADVLTGCRMKGKLKRRNIVYCHFFHKHQLRFHYTS